MENIIIKLFGQNAMDKLIQTLKDPIKRQDIYADYCDLLDAIDDFKKNISEDKIINNESRGINCGIFSKFLDNDKSINILIDEFNKNCNKKWRITKYNDFRKK